MKPDIIQALEALKPGAQWTLIHSDTATSDYERLVWHDTNQTKPSEEEVVRKIAELEYEYEVTNDYKSKRAVAYPSYADQLDRIFHDGLDAWKTDIQGIKNQNPKKTVNYVDSKERQDKAVEDWKSS